MKRKNENDIASELAAEHLTETTEESVEIEDITLIRDEDVSVPSKIVSITMSATQDPNTLELSDDHLEDIKAVFIDQIIAFSPTVMGLGIAVKDKAGYWPVPSDWYTNREYMGNADYADQLNVHGLGLDEKEASKIVLSSMNAQHAQE